MYLGDLILSVSVHVDLHPVAAASEVVTYGPEDVDSDIRRVGAETVADESVTSAMQQYESLPARMIQGDHLKGKRFDALWRIWPRIDHDSL